MTQKSKSTLGNGFIAVSRLALLLIAIAALGFLLVEPHLEGRNAKSTLFAIYFNDPFLAYAYIASIPFFIGIYQANKALWYAGRNSTISPPTVSSLQTIKRCALALIAFVMVGLLIILLSDSDDRAGGVAICVLLILGSTVTATIARVLERNFRKALIHVPAA